MVKITLIRNLNFILGDIIDCLKEFYVEARYITDECALAINIILVRVVLHIETDHAASHLKRSPLNCFFKLQTFHD